MNRAALVDIIRAKKSLLCVGLDTDPEKLPAHLRGEKDGVVRFNKAIIDATADYAVAYKLNTAFYEAQGVGGWEALEETRAHIPENVFTIADAKRGDIGNTAAQYARTFFQTYPFDSITVAPYMGRDSVEPFLQTPSKWAIVLGLTSNPGADDFEKLMCDGKPLYEHVLEKVSSWGSPENLMFVVGATRPEELARIRTILPEHFLLIPGVGAQGGTVKDVCKAAVTADGGLLINVSRGIQYATSGEDFAEAAGAAAKKYQGEMAAYLR
jgi:orotidine-5'-phosphate decarboxylase